MHVCSSDQIHGPGWPKHCVNASTYFLSWAESACPARMCSWQTSKVAAILKTRQRQKPLIRYSVTGLDGATAKSFQPQRTSHSYYHALTHQLGAASIACNTPTTSANRVQTSLQTARHNFSVVRALDRYPARSYCGLKGRPAPCCMKPLQRATNRAVAMCARGNVLALVLVGEQRVCGMRGQICKRTVPAILVKVRAQLLSWERSN